MGEGRPLRVGVFGGSFNPPHVGHVLAVTLVLSTCDVDEVWVIPTYRHPFQKALAPFEDRFDMCSLAMSWLPRVRISRVEQTLGGDSLTLRTLTHLRNDAERRGVPQELRLIVGADILAEAHKWVGFDRIRELAPPLVLGRAGVSGKDAPLPLLPQVSSTEVRNLIGQGAWDTLANLVPRSVIEHVRAYGLYGAPGGPIGEDPTGESPTGARGI